MGSNILFQMLVNTNLFGFKPKNLRLDSASPRETSLIAVKKKPEWNHDHSCHSKRCERAHQHDPEKRLFTDCLCNREGTENRKHSGEHPQCHKYNNKLKAQLYCIKNYQPPHPGETHPALLSNRHWFFCTSARTASLRYSLIAFK